MKAREDQGVIKIYKILPDTWNSVNGHITNFKNSSKETLEQEGFFDVVKPAYDNRIQKLGALEWDNTNKIFTYPVDDLTINESLAELKVLKKQAVKDLAYKELSKTDWYIIRASDIGSNIPDDIKTERQAIRTKVVEREAEIDALSTKKLVLTWSPILFDPPELGI